MLIVADTHLHLYPCYKLVPAIKGLLQCLHQQASGDVIAVGLLAERYDCHYFSLISQGLLDSHFTVDKKWVDDGVLKLTENGKSLFLFAGRQIISLERIEVLALTTDIQIEDGLPAKVIIERILNEKAIPVLSWAPGKWFFKRKKIIKDLLDTFSPQQLVIGDTSLRPKIWTEPLLMKRARLEGYPVICGSDPLPFPGEESLMGSYCSICQANFDVSDPLRSLRDLLTDGSADLKRGGRRCTLGQTIARLKKNKKSKRG
ncbi:MAG: hypothetical protein GY705_21565 [Bacteroidetes bacterium]|nr:hypothetical protein [Bacteroidota bacterium]